MDTSKLDLEIEFSGRVFQETRNTLIIIGRQGSGKTRSLEAIRKVMYPFGIMISGDIISNTNKKISDALLNVESGTILAVTVNLG